MFKFTIRLLPLFVLLVTLSGCGRSDSNVIDPDELSAQEAEELRKANEEYEAYMNE